MATYTTVADGNGDFAVSFPASYTGGEKITVTSEKDSATKTIELYAPSEVIGGGAIQFSGTMDNFPLNIGNVILSNAISGVIQNNALIATQQDNNIFYRATGLIISGSVTEIKNYSFTDWRYASLLQLPSTLQKIGEYAFQNFGSSAPVFFDCVLPNSVTNLSNYCFSRAGFKNFDIGSGVLTIPDNSFEYTSKLETFNYRNVKTVNGSAFYSSAIKYNIIPDTVTMIGGGAYQYAASLEVNTGNGITSIPAFAFAGNDKCTKFTIGLNVLSILSNGIAGLTSCNELICLPVNPPDLNSSGLSSLKSTCVIKVPVASLSAYQTAPNWSAHAAKMVGV
ncbi:MULTISPECIES: leucine-rich repeat domain-containing protein [unclassified Acinetobacter]|uniref:leucine-rich repeat domain-containing protein n=1 Tax=unclassified Acinetobacter TaxID=196816 RepID=UPI0015D3B0DC|nr:MULTISPECIES: leucine-rich repeat domain-containing protein [unclassified Acinetobacter]